MEFGRFEVLWEVMDQDYVDNFKNVILPTLTKHPLQNGYELTNSGLVFPNLEEYLEERNQRKLTLRLNMSSCRIQEPTVGALSLHQDYVAMEKSGSKMPVSVTVWIPLDDIDDYTPTLELCPELTHIMHPHIRDENRYAVMEKEVDCSLVSLTRIKAGTGVLISPLCMHRSSVKPWHTKIRHSLDLRFVEQT